MRMMNWLAVAATLAQFGCGTIARPVPSGGEAILMTGGEWSTLGPIQDAAAQQKSFRIEEAAKEFAGTSWGVGPSLTIDWGKHDRVESASVDANNIVRVDDVNNSIPRLTLETHYFFLPKGRFFGLLPADNLWGIGPFVAIQASSDDIVDAIGFGLMVGFRYSEESKTSFNFGLGAMVDPNAKVLGDGIEENKPLPVGETSVRFKEENQWGYLMMFSFSF